MHCRFVQWRTLPEDRIPQKWGPNPGVVDHIAVPFSLGVITRVKAGCRLLHIANHDVLGKVSRQPMQKPVTGSGRTRRKTGDLADRMDSGIGSARCHHPHWLAGKLAERLLDHLLNGDPVRLDLPATVVGPVVSERHPQCPCPVGGCPLGFGHVGFGGGCRIVGLTRVQVEGKRVSVQRCVPLAGSSQVFDNFGNSTCRGFDFIPCIQMT